MSQLGRIEQWNDDKGYGFVRPLESQAGADAPRAFVHVKAIARAGRRPAEGDLVRYEVQRDAKGRLNAVGVAFVNAAAMRAQTQAREDARSAARERHASSGRRVSGLRRGLAAGAAVALLGGVWLGFWPVLVPLAYAVMSLLSFLAYRNDKVRAERDRWRTPESTLHMLDLLGGWPGGLLAQQMFRHKSSKGSFQFTFWITVLLNCAMLAWLAYAGRLDPLWRALLAS